jgi:hypothetical protein
MKRGKPEQCVGYFQWQLNTFLFVYNYHHIKHFCASISATSHIYAWHNSEQRARAGCRPARRSHRASCKAEGRKVPAPDIEVCEPFRAARSARADHHRRHTFPDPIRAHRRSCCQWQPPFAAASEDCGGIGGRYCRSSISGELLHLRSHRQDFRLRSRCTQRQGRRQCWAMSTAFLSARQVAAANQAGGRQVYHHSSFADATTDCLRTCSPDCQFLLAQTSFPMRTAYPLDPKPALGFGKALTE